MFAKLFGPPDNQILITHRDNDAGYDICVMIQPEGYGVCETSLHYPEEQEDLAYKVFEELDEAGARFIASPILKALQK